VTRLLCVEMISPVGKDKMDQIVNSPRNAWRVSSKLTATCPKVHTFPG
jgi:hypothetical protein